MGIRRIIVSYFIPASAKIRGAVAIGWESIILRRRSSTKKLELGSTPERLQAVHADDGISCRTNSYLYVINP